MAIEDQIADLIPLGEGEVLWLGPQHAQRLVDGLEMPDEPLRAIVLQGLLGRFKNPNEILRQLEPTLAADGVVVVVATSRHSAKRRGVFTRRELLDTFADAGYDVMTCTVIPDPDMPRPALTLLGTPARPADEVEESTSTALLVSARRAIEAPPECSIVTNGHYESPRSGQVEVVSVHDEQRARAWNRGARKATGKYIAFLDINDRTSPGWLERLLKVVRANPDAGAVGALAVDFGPESIPCHQLPFRVRPRSTGNAAAVEGSGMLLARCTFVAAGGFDPLLGSRFDGPDLCLRLRARGLDVICARQVGVTSVEAPASTAGGARYFIHKWRGQIPPGDEQQPAKRRTAARTDPAPVLWSAPLLQRSGYGEEARNFILALDRHGIAVQGNPTEWQAEAELPRATARRLGALLTTEAPARFINIVNSFPAARMMLDGSNVTHPLVQHFKPHPRAVRNIGRTMYETDRIPPEWVEACNEMDEVWVPSTFNVHTFARAGVAREKLYRIPGAIDASRFDPDIDPMYLPQAKGFVFLSVFAWSLRKGWDVLLRAFLEEFEAAEDVTLVLKVLPHWNRSVAQHEAEMGAYARDVLGRDLRRGPRIVVLTRSLAAAEMPRLYRAADAFVMPSRGEGYGVPYLEAMAMGLPTIGTRWGGNVDFMTDENSYLVDCAEVEVPDAALRDIPDFAGHRWAEPDASALRVAMRAIFEDRAEAGRRAARGRRKVLEHHAWEPVARAITARLEEAGAPPLRSSTPDTLPVTWEGPQRIAFGIAEVNRGTTSALRGIASIDLQTSETPVARPWLWGRTPEVTVRHQWPPNFQPPVKGRWITYQPWEYGSLPAAWIQPMNRQVDEVWVPTTYVRDCFVRSGVDAEKVAIVPYGVDPARFHPDVPPLALATRKKHRFLFVGGTIARKGIDILVDTYVATFSPADDVCLVIKDLGGSTFYQGQGMAGRIKALQAAPENPEILYLDQEMPESEMPGLYTACQALVHPYRGEGFGMPIAEAMACGLAVIVTGHGACLDFCDDSVALLIAAREVRRPELRIGAIATVDLPWWAEVDPTALALAMRRVIGKPAEARALGRRASARIRSEWTLERAATVAAGRLQALVDRPPRLTVCLAIKKKQASLRRCLESLRDLAYEVVVVEDAAADGMAAVASGYGAKVVKFAGSAGPAGARNEALRHATGDWILVVDPDEWLDEGARREIRHLISGDRRAAFVLSSIGVAPGSANAAPRLRVRLFPNHPALRFAGTDGEALVDGSGGPVAGELSRVVVHRGGKGPRRGK